MSKSNARSKDTGEQAQRSRRVSARGLKKRPIGLDKGRVKVPKKFFEPLPDELLDGFQKA